MQALGGAAKKLTAGFRWAFRICDGSPLDCDSCSESETSARNCGNRLALSEEARAVNRYTGDITDEHRIKSAQKVLSLGDIRFYECPLSYISADSRELIRMVFLSEATGALPCRDGLGQQPYWFIEAVEIGGFERAAYLQRKKDEG